MLKTRTLALIGLLTAVALAPPASAAREFSERSIRGTWALSVEGYTTEGALERLVPTGTPLFAIGRVIFDGAGGCRSDDQLVIGTTAVPADPAEQRTATHCRYEVQPDGYGFFVVVFRNLRGNGSSATTARFIIESNRSIRFIADNEELGIFGGGVLVRQSPRIR